jgi:hypothetical protein
MNRVKRQLDLRDPTKNRAAYISLYRAVRKLIGLGANPSNARRAFELTAASRWWDTGELDDYELENYDSIRARAIDDAIEGRPPCPIWGDDEPEQGRE